ncbi:MlaA family lipoprotein [Citreimonas salinaria]|uniref:Phospholipid-binding lipoprotein MlaA n=1 Tax=Citreimonas salinaria TaxID=321339 RepID=A0A1H3F2V9_9RHOB|nr:VacJ family lipoprotein [Citreimonas salinaria]SDX85215.1 phospholipid-binding lipoprotein MlaA [Citreimonas salinaria]
MGAGRAISLLIVVAAMAGCTAAVPDPGFNDPYEAQNRRVHAFNTSVDEGIVSRAGRTYVAVASPTVRTGVSNVADTLSLPRTVVNQVLQGRLLRAGRNTLRFAVNATLGFGGIADVAADMGLEHDETDFGETLHVWGVAEGAYLEVPFVGPTTQRDLAGSVVDIFLNPLDPRLEPGQRRAKLALRVLDKVGERADYAASIDSVLHESADSYSQVRLMYLQNRRYELGATPPEAVDADPLALDTEGF